MRRFSNLFVDVCLSFLVYVLPIVTVHAFRLVGEHLVRSAGHRNREALAWTAAEWWTVLVAQLLLLGMLIATRRRSPWLRWPAVLATLVAITVALSIALLQAIPVRFLIETDTTPERHPLVHQRLEYWHATRRSLARTDE